MLLRHANGSFDFGALTGNYDLAGSVDICNIYIGVGGQGADRIFIRADHRRHRA